LGIHSQTSTDSRYYQAEIDYQTTKWSEALKGFKLLFSDTALAPNSAVAYRISVCHERLGSIPEALIYAEKACALDTSESEYLLHYARLLEMKYDYAKSWDIRLKLIAQEPRFISRYEEALQNALNRNDYPQGLQITQMWKAQFGHNLNLTQKTAQLFLAINDTIAAKQEYKRLIDKHQGRPDIIQAYNAFLQQISPKTKNTGPCPQAYAVLNTGNPEYAYTIIKSCAQENPENLALLEQQFLMAYIKNDLPEMESCIENLYAYFPFLETHTLYAEAVKSFLINNRIDITIPAFSPSIHWHYIHAQILYTTNQPALARKQLESIIKSNPNNTEIPRFYINKLLNEIPAK
jgi:tetratricopeptide (TPR) repeat protein